MTTPHLVTHTPPTTPASVATVTINTPPTKNPRHRRRHHRSGQGHPAPKPHPTPHTPTTHPTPRHRLTTHTPHQRDTTGVALRLEAPYRGVLRHIFCRTAAKWLELHLSRVCLGLPCGNLWCLALFYDTERIGVLRPGPCVRTPDS